MQAMKVTCLGQTFALANNSDSGGKKSRIRRSKEERKDMVVSFIKKYQNANDGSFPSLNLTHKEVGGSFYTVREIVREVIQENRVLGPAKFTSDEQKNDEFSEQYPLGSISTQPPSDLSFSPNGTHFVSHANSVELITNLSEQINGKQQRTFDNDESNNEILVDKEVNGTDATKSSSPVNGETKDSDVEINHKLLGDSERVEEFVRSPTSKVTSIATDVVVETFPLISSPKQKQGMDETSVEAINSNTALEEAPETVKTDLLEKLDLLESENQHCSSLDEKSTKKPVDPLFESSNCSTSDKNVMGSSSVEETEVQVEPSSGNLSTLQDPRQNQVVPEVETKLAPNGIDAQNKNAETTVTGSTAVTSDSLSTEEGRNSTLNRINLESWDGASKKCLEGETNPAWAIVKSFINAFMKFWTE